MAELPAGFEDISDRDVSQESVSSEDAGIVQARALNNKALLCLEISQRIFPESGEELESIAVELMYLTDNGINRILRRLRTSNSSSQSFSSISLTKDPVPGTGIVQEEKKVKKDRYSILRRENDKHS